MRPFQEVSTLAMPKALLGSWRLRQLHVVAAGVHALLARFKEPAASLRQGRALLQVAHKFEDVLALPITARFDAASRHEGLGLVAQDFLDLAGCPDEELALFALTVGVLGGIEPGSSSSAGTAWQMLHTQHLHAGRI